MKTIKITTFITFCFLLLSFNLSNSQSKPTIKASQKTENVEANIIKKTYTLKGFKQSCCTGIVEYSLKEVEGYIKSEANVKQRELTVWFDASICTEAAIKKAINKTAYKIEG